MAGYAECLAGFIARLGLGRPSMRSFHPVGFRAMARASAEDLREVLPGVPVATLLVYGDRDVRAPLTVADHPHQAISGSTLVVLPGAGHLCKIEGRASIQRRRPSVPARTLSRRRLPVLARPLAVGLAQWWGG